MNMSRPVTLFTGQWADLPFETVCKKAKSFGYDGLELACWGDHFEVNKAFDIASARRALAALKNHPSFGFNYDPSHFGYQGVDYIEFIHTFSDRIFHVHMKDVGWSDVPVEAGVFGGHTEFGTKGRYWDFRSLGRGNINFEEIIRALNRIGYKGPLSVEWEDSGMDREHGAVEACQYVKAVDFAPSNIAFDSAFEK
jgi:sugar phosphate isomerase/epimerase